MDIDLSTVISQAQQACDQANDRTAIMNAKSAFLGKKGPLTALFSKMKEMTPDQKRELGLKINEAKTQIAKLFEDKLAQIEQRSLEEKLAKERLDISLPGHGPKAGTEHPYTKIVDLLTDFFVGYGYTVKDGPEVESDYFNFECLNIPADHPARDMQDSFFLDNGMLLRSHTSPVQARTMQDKNEELPLKIICPGKVYRRDNDATHSHQFGQIEGLCIGKDVTLANLTRTLSDMFKYLFGPKVEARFRPSFFPFTEPSIECDVSCFECHGKGCALCKGSGWIEVLGAGMVNPNVFRLNGIDADVWQGFAFGIGIERMAMLLYGIDDIHRFYQDDQQFLQQFSKK